MGSSRDDSTTTRRRRAALVALLGATASPFVLGVVTARADELPVPAPAEAPVETVLELPADVPVVDEVVAVVEDVTGTGIAAVEPTVVTITPSVDEAPVVDRDEAGPTVTVEPATAHSDAEVTVTAVAQGADVLAVVINPEQVDVGEPTPEPLAVTVTAPSTEHDRPTALVEVDDAGVVTGVTLTPAAGGPDVLQVDLWDSADALQAPRVFVGGAGSSLVRITLPAPPVVRGVAVTTPALAAGLPTVKLRSLGADGDVVRVTLVPNPLPLPIPTPTVPGVPLPTIPLPGVPPTGETPPTTVVPDPVPEAPAGEAPAPAAEPGAPVVPSTTVTTPPTTVAPVFPAADTAAAPAAPTTVAPPLPAPADGGFGLVPDAAPAVVGDIGRRSVEAARRFPIPTGLALAVGIFLLVQARFDRRDPRLATAPAHDELMSFR